MIDPFTLYPISMQTGSRLRGALMRKGDEWPRHVPAWHCEHWHESAKDAEACAQDELARRVTEASTPSVEDSAF
jgi:hypothetical protein